ncbi:MAG: sigma-70 family RNA polymerase sigma factor [Vicinamibacterales bacterium]
MDTHGDVLFRYALVRVRDESVAEELVQDTFVAALQAQDTFAERSSPRTWLVGILKHKIMDHFRRVSRDRPSVTPEADRDRQLFETGTRNWDHDIGPADWGSDPELAVQREQFWRVLQRCLGELPPRLSMAFTMREVDGLETGELCKVLDVTTTNLWVMLHRARAHLRLCLENHWIKGIEHP